MRDSSVKSLKRQLARDWLISADLALYLAISDQGFYFGFLRAFFRFFHSRYSGTEILAVVLGIGQEYAMLASVSLSVCCYLSFIITERGIKYRLSILSTYIILHDTFPLQYQLFVLRQQYIDCVVTE